jgi:hypothetical protein
VSQHTSGLASTYGAPARSCCCLYESITPRRSFCWVRCLRAAMPVGSGLSAPQGEHRSPVKRGQRSDPPRIITIQIIVLEGVAEKVFGWWFRRYLVDSCVLRVGKVFCAREAYVGRSSRPGSRVGYRPIRAARVPVARTQRRVAEHRVVQSFQVPFSEINTLETTKSAELGVGDLNGA